MSPCLLVSLSSCPPPATNSDNHGADNSFSGIPPRFPFFLPCPCLLCVCSVTSVLLTARFLRLVRRFSERRNFGASPKAGLRLLVAALPRLGLCGESGLFPRPLEFANCEFSRLGTSPGGDPPRCGVVSRAVACLPKVGRPCHSARPLVLAVSSEEATRSPAVRSIPLRDGPTPAAATPSRRRRHPRRVSSAFRLRGAGRRPASSCNIPGPPASLSRFLPRLRFGLACPRPSRFLPRLRFGLVCRFLPSPLAPRPSPLLLLVLLRHRRLPPRPVPTPRLVPGPRRRTWAGCRLLPPSPRRQRVFPWPLAPGP